MTTKCTKGMLYFTYQTTCYYTGGKLASDVQNKNLLAGTKAVNKSILNPNVKEFVPRSARQTSANVTGDSGTRINEDKRNV